MLGPRYFSVPATFRSPRLCFRGRGVGEGRAEGGGKGEEGKGGRAQEWSNYSISLGNLDLYMNQLVSVGIGRGPVGGSVAGPADGLSECVVLDGLLLGITPDYPPGYPLGRTQEHPPKDPG
jgi:hypothetical protein